VEFKNFLLSVENKVAVLTINRPDVRNAMSAECWEELGRFIDDANADDEIQVIVITGAGDKAFIAGADLNLLKIKTSADVLGGSAQHIVKKIEDCSKPVIAAINGLAFGGGCEIALACDIRMVAENALFGLPETALGLLPGCGGTQRLSKLIGLGRAKEVILAGRTITAPEAVQFGLAYKCVPAADLMQETLAVAKEMMKKGPLALRLCKRLISASMSTDQETGMLLEIYGLSILMGSADKVEGIDAFFAKRKPEYKGR
jgi:enoyl-CoA hydratase